MVLGGMLGALAVAAIAAAGPARITAAAGGGVDGYTGGLADSLQPGPAWSVTADVTPWRLLGAEFNYTGSVNEFDQEMSDNLQSGSVRGADLVRNGGHLALKFGLLRAFWQPYVMGGVGLSGYDVRAPEVPTFSDGLVGFLPFGVGVRYQRAVFSADARVVANYQFDDQNFLEQQELSYLRYNVLVQAGATF